MLCKLCKLSHVIVQVLQKAAPVLEEAEALLSGTLGDAAPEVEADRAQLLQGGAEGKNGQVAGNCLDKALSA